MPGFERCGNVGCYSLDWRSNLPRSGFERLPGRFIGGECGTLGNVLPLILGMGKFVWQS